MVDDRPRPRPMARTTIPTTAAANPSRTPVWPSVPFTDGGPPARAGVRSRWSLLSTVRCGDPFRVLGDVVRRVLHQDLVGDEGRTAEVALGDHRDVGLEQFGRAPGVLDGEPGRPRGDHEVDTAGRGVDRAGSDDTL